MSIYCGFESLRAGNGGICRVARLICKVLTGDVNRHLLNMNAAVLSDWESHDALSRQIHLCHGSRLKFVMSVTMAMVSHTHFLYDCGGMARAHVSLPLLKRPYLTWLHGIEAWAGTAHPRQVQALSRASMLLVNSEYTRERASRHTFKLGNARVCWLATETDIAVRQSSIHESPRVMILGRLDDALYKGHIELLTAWRHVRSAVPDAILTIVGSGPGEARLRAVAEQYGLSPEQVEFRGFVPDDELDRLWESTRVLAMPSRGEGFGLVYIEAMRHGIPVIASIHDAGQEVNVHEQTGYNVNLDKADDLTDRLIHLLRNPDHAAALGIAGQKRWADHFRYSCFRERFRPLLYQFLKM